MEMNKKRKSGNSQTSKSDREIALDIIIGVMEREEFSHVLLRNTFEKQNNLEKSSRKFITRLVEGTIEKTITLDYILNLYSKIQVDKMKPVIRNLLRMSVYQLRYMTAVPDSAVCNEAVKMAKKRGFVNLAGFVNGVLRNVIREPERIVYPSEDEISYLSVLYSMPQWIVTHFVDSYGMETAKTILKGIEEAAEDTGTTVRVNGSKAGIEQVEELLLSEGAEVERSPFADMALRIRNYDSLTALSAFQRGYIQVQNISSILAGQVADVKPGDVCMDVCAAPGGKTLHLADKLQGTGTVVSRDISEKKCRMIRENVERTGFQNIEVQVWDALEYDEKVKESADLVIVDVPCSGLGVIAGKPDIKYHLQPEQLKELANLSQKILSNVVYYIKHGGALIFSTCTINPAENTKIRDWLIKEHKLIPVDIRLELPEPLLNYRNNRETAADGYIQIYTSKDMDGFFISKFRKI